MQFWIWWIPLWAILSRRSQKEKQILLSLIHSGPFWRHAHPLWLNLTSTRVLSMSFAVPRKSFSHVNLVQNGSAWIQSGSEWTGEKSICFSFRDRLNKMAQNGIHQMQNFTFSVGLGVLLYFYSLPRREESRRNKLSECLYVRSTLIGPTTTYEKKGVIFYKTWPKVIEGDEFESYVSFHYLINY